MCKKERKKKKIKEGRKERKKGGQKRYGCFHAEKKGSKHF